MNFLLVQGPVASSESTQDPSSDESLSSTSFDKQSSSDQEAPNFGPGAGTVIPKPGYAKPTVDPFTTTKRSIGTSSLVSSATKFEAGKSQSDLKNPRIEQPSSPASATPKPLGFQPKKPPPPRIRQKLSETSQERHVPSSRAGRAVTFGSLFAGLAVGAATEAAKKAMGFA